MLLDLTQKILNENELKSPHLSHEQGRHVCFVFAKNKEQNMKKITFFACFLRVTKPN